MARIWKRQTSICWFQNRFVGSLGTEIRPLLSFGTNQTFDEMSDKEAKAKSKFVRRARSAGFDLERWKGGKKHSSPSSRLGIESSLVTMSNGSLKVPLPRERSSKSESRRVVQAFHSYQQTRSFCHNGQVSLMETPDQPSSVWSKAGIWQETRLSHERKMLGHRSGRKEEETFTLVSYNVLADELVRTHPELYRGTSQEYLVWENRYPRLLEKILALKPDILSLQEVQKEHFNQFLTDLTEHGFSGVYKQRTGNKSDGCATFFSSKFVLEDSLGVEYFQPGIDCLDRDNVALLVRLRSKKQPNCRLVIGNTHLLYNPNRQDVKLAQSAILLAELDRIATPIDSAHGTPHRVPCIITGDFNFQPESPVYNFLCGGNFKFGGLFSRPLQVRGGGKILQNALIPKRLGITDQCKHFDAAAGKNSLDGDSNSKDSKEFRHGQYHRLAPTPNIPKNSKIEKESGMFESGSLFNDFGLRSVYPARGSLGSTKQDGWVQVDHMFYSTQFSHKYQKYIEGHLKLLSKLILPKATDCAKTLKQIPNEICPSDHLPIGARFLLNK